MPKIQVNEKDMSWYYRSRDPGALTVLMPVVSTWGPYEPTLVDALNFESVYGSEPVDSADLSYPMAASFVRNGISVLGVRVNIGGAQASYDPNPEDPETHVRPDVTIPPIQFVANYTGTWANGLKVETSALNVRYRSPDSPGGTSKVAKTVSELDDYRPGSDSNPARVLYTGEDSGVYKQNHIVNVFNTVAYDEDLGEASVVSASITVNVSKDGRIVESNTFEFIDQNSSNYYQQVNTNDTVYVDVLPIPGDPAANPPVPMPMTVVETVAAATGSIEGTLSGGTNSGEEASVDYSTYDRAQISQNLPQILADTVADLRDPIIYDFDIIVDGGYNTQTLTEDDPTTPTDEATFATDATDVDKMWISVAKNKGTAVYLVDGSAEMGASDFYSYCGGAGFTSNTVGDYLYDNAASYCAAYGPWCNAQLMSTGVLRVLPGSYVLLTAWARAISNGAPAYLAPAGVKRTSLGEIVQSTVYPVGSAVIDSWQNHEWTNMTATYKVNPIARLKQYGYCVYGNSTLLKSVSSRTSMLQSLSTRIVSNMIKKRALDITLKLQFDQIDDDIFAEFRAMMTEFMDELKYGGALYDYSIVADYANMTYDNLNQRTIPVKILISPNPAVENFIIDLEIYPAGVTFGDDTQQNLQLRVQ